ncbi:hypothetical protein [Corynebacterium gerontici]|uniref:DUF8185 domain-containing protein n=1 Tax=Corynebacterium gerontici TaxID=2079234 RepID=A0A3G6J1S5_9CORY|nr:hypothetical protein [Corynebacterium gerontici]AZA11967.1 hypothetical protein CGERO_08360 [Corynebacterium gerontici]
MFIPQGNVAAILRRALRFDQQALARIRPVGQGAELFVTTPFDPLIALRVPEAPAGVMAVADVLTGTGGADRQASWPGALPPENFELIDEIPGVVVEKLVQAGRDEAKAHSGPLGVPRNLLDQAVLTVEGRALPLRLLFACDAFGLIPPSESAVSRVLRVSAAGRWVRLDSVIASAYYSPGLPLL